MRSHNTLLKKVIILFISIFIPLTIFCLYELNSSNQKLKEQVLISMDANNSSYLQQLDSSIDDIYINNFNLLDQSNFQKIANDNLNSSSYEKSIQINLLREQISNICIVSPFVESAHVYYKKWGIAHHSSGYKHGSYHYISEKELMVLKELEQDKKPLKYYLDPVTKEWTLAFFFFPKLSDDYSGSVVLSQKKLQEYLEANISYENEGYVILSDTGFSLTNFDSRQFQNILDMQDEIYERKSDKNYKRMTLNGMDYYVFFYEMSGATAKYIRFIPTKSLMKNINISPILFVFFLTIVFAACILFFIGIYRLVHKPLIHLTTAFEELEEGNFKIQIQDNQNTDFAYLYQAFNNMSLKLGKLIERDYNQKMLLQKAELKQLQAQINPHFLYNSFFMLQRMIKMEMMEEAQEIANALGVYFRYLTRNSMDHVTLAEEYEHAKTYAYIQGLRFAGRIQIDFEEMPSEFAKLPVPKLILQPILENAFNYGLNNKIKDGLLEIHFSSEENALTIIVEENGEELTDELLNSLAEKLEAVKNSSGHYEMTGLLNIQRRLIVYSNSRHSLHVFRSHLGGLGVSITLRKNDEEVL